MGGMYDRQLEELNRTVKALVDQHRRQNDFIEWFVLRQTYAEEPPPTAVRERVTQLERRLWPARGGI